MVENPKGEKKVSFAPQGFVATKFYAQDFIHPYFMTKEVNQLARLHVKKVIFLLAFRKIFKP